MMSKEWSNAFSNWDETAEYSGSYDSWMAACEYMHKKNLSERVAYGDDIVGYMETIKELRAKLAGCVVALEYYKTMTENTIASTKSYVHEDMIIRNRANEALTKVKE